MLKTDLDQQISDTSVCCVCPPDPGCVGHVETDLDNQIAAVEREIALCQEAIRSCDLRIEALDGMPSRKRSVAQDRKDREILSKTLTALQAKHEQLVRRVQWATVGAAKPREAP